MAEGTKRRDVLKTALYVTPAILTFPVLPAAARSGSEKNEKKKDKDKDYYKDKDYKDKDKDDYDKKWKGGRGWKGRD
jgi:hypothetical protein